MHTPTIDPDSPLLVGKGILSLAVLGAATGGTIGALRAQNPVLLAMTMGVNGSVAGLAFFGIREYLVSPVLVATLDWPSYAQRRALGGMESQPRQEIGKSKDLGPDVKTPDLVAAIRNDKILDSCLAGGLAGSAISGMFRGARTVPAAFITSALITSSLQYGINSVRAARVQTLLTRQQATESDADGVPIPAISSTSLSPASTAPTATTTARPTILARIKESLASLSPVRKLSNEEYAQILLRQRDAVTADLEAYERWARARASARDGGGDEREGKLERPKINVEQAVRELDGLERKIRALEGRQRAEEDEEKPAGTGL